MNVTDRLAPHHPHTSVRRPPAPWLPAAAVLWSAATAVLGLWWVLDPAAYPLDDGNSDFPTGLTMIVPAGAAAVTLLALGLAGVVLALALARADDRTPGRRALVVAGGTYAAVFGIVIPDVQLLSFLGYALALAGPLVVPVLLAAGARRHPRNLVLLALIGLAITAGVATGQIGEPTLQMLRGMRDGVGRVGLRPLALAVMVVGAGLFALLTLAVARRDHAPSTPPSGRARLNRWGEVATWVAAACPLPYVLIRMTWLTPWPRGAPGGPDSLDGGIRVFGLLLGLAALGGAALTVGLISRWGEVFPAWLPGLRGRPVPVLAAVVPAGVVSLVLCASAISIVMMSTRDGTGWLLAAIPAPLWGPALGLATYAYYERRNAVRPANAVGRRWQPQRRGVPRAVAGGAHGAHDAWRDRSGE